jgi:hypothetical protein
VDTGTDLTEFIQSKSVLLQSVLEVFSNEEDSSSHPAETSGSRKWEKELFGTFFFSTAVI